MMKTVADLLQEMSQATREALPDDAFVFSGERKWPIEPKKWAIAAIRSMVMGRGTAAAYPQIVAAIRRKYGKDKQLMQFLDNSMKAIKK